jgi:WD40 repeat protein
MSRVNVRAILILTIVSLTCPVTGDAQGTNQPGRTKQLEAEQPHIGFPKLTVSTGHTRDVTWLGYSADGSVLASVDTWGLAIFWSTSTGQQLSHVQISPHPMFNGSPVLFTAGHKAYAASLNSVLIFDYLDPSNSKVEFTTKEAPQLQALSTDNIFLVYIADSRLHAYNTRSRNDSVITTVPNDEASFAVFKRDSHELAIADSSGRYSRLTLPTRKEVVFRRVHGRVESIAFDEDSHLLVAIWQDEDAEDKTRTTFGANSVLDTSSGADFTPQNIVSLTLIPDVGRIRICRANGMEITAAKERGASAYFGQCPSTIAISPDRHGVAISYANSISLLKPVSIDEPQDTDKLAMPDRSQSISLQSYQLLQKPVIGVRDLAWVPGTSFLCVLSPAAISYWDLSRGQQRFWSFETSAFAFSADGHWVLRGNRITENSRTKTVLQMIDRTTSPQKVVDLGITVQRYKNHDPFGFDWEVGRFRLSENGSDIVSVNTSGSLIKTSAQSKTAEKLCRIRDVRSPAARSDEQFETSTSGNMMVASCEMVGEDFSRSPGIYVWNIKGAADPVRVADPNDLMAASFSRDDQLIALAFPHEVQVIDLRENKTLMKQTLDDASVYRAVTFNVDGDRLAVGASGLMRGSVQLWDLVSRRQGPFVPTRDSDVTSLLFGSNGLLLVGSSNGTVDLYNKYANDLLLRLICVPALGGLSIDPTTGAFDGTAEAMDMAGWRLTRDDPVIYPLNLFFEDYYTPGLSQKILSNGNHGQIEPFRASVQLKIPGLKVALEQHNMAIRNVQGRPALCFSAPPTAEVSDSIDVTYRGDATRIAKAPTTQTSDADCHFAVFLNGTIEDYQVIGKVRTSSPSDVGSLASPSSPVGNATVHFQAVAISNYPTQSGLPVKLPKATTDAGTVQQAVEAYKKTGVNVHVWEPLLDASATQVGIRQRLFEIASQSSEQDIVILFFAGHGLVPLGDRMFYFAPVDFLLEGAKNGLSTPMIADAVRSMRARRILLVLDACQSGGTLDALAKVLDAKVVADTFEYANKTVPPGIEIIAAATPIQEAIETTQNGGLLAKAIADSLSGGQTTAKSLGESAKHRVIALVEQLNEQAKQNGTRLWQQTPVIFAVGTDFDISSPSNH